MHSLSALVLKLKLRFFSFNSVVFAFYYKVIFVSVQTHNVWDNGEDVYEIDLTNSQYGCCQWACMKHCQHFNVYQLGYHFYNNWLGDGRLCFGETIYH